MGKNKVRYFNVPIQLLKHFLTNSKNTLEDICDYTIYEYLVKNKLTNDIKNIEHADFFFKVITGDKERTFKNGKLCYDDIPLNSPKVGINTSIWFDFYKNRNKTEFEKVCLLMFLAMKSIVQNKAYCKADNMYLLSRMDGKCKSVSDVSELSTEIQKYSTRYQLTKIKNELRENWGLKYYSRNTRGFYISYVLSYEELVFQAEKRRKSNKTKQRKKAEQEAYEKAINRLNSS